MIRRSAFCLAAALAVFIHPAWPLTPEERRQYLENLLKTLPEVPSFREWLRKTG